MKPPKTKSIDPAEINYMKSLSTKLTQIEEKNRCIRVQFLDWLSVKLKNWSIAVKLAANNIHSPCIIKMPMESK